MPEFSSNGVSIYYEVTGEGFPLVLGTRSQATTGAGSPKCGSFLESTR